ncbi:hypothetical protein B0H14DRAFT_2747676, partial [Mycena olivaceomarginata]
MSKFSRCHAKIWRLPKCRIVSHIRLSIGLGLFLFILLFRNRETSFQGERNLAVGTRVTGWTVEILAGTLTINEYFNIINTRRKTPVILKPDTDRGRVRAWTWWWQSLRHKHTPVGWEL